MGAKLNFWLEENLMVSFKRQISFGGLQEAVSTQQTFSLPENIVPRLHHSFILDPLSYRTYVVSDCSTREVYMIVSKLNASNLQALY